MFRMLLVITALVALVSGKPDANHALPNQPPDARNSVREKANGANGEKTPELTNNDAVNGQLDTRPIDNGHKKKMPDNGVQKDNKAPEDKPDFSNKGQITSPADKTAEHEMGKDAGIQIPLTAPYAGRVVEVAFEALLLTNRELQGDVDVVVFDYVQFNIGEAYNPITGQFTVPVDGIYLVHYAVRAQVYMWFHLHRPGETLAVTIPNYYGTSAGAIVGGASDTRLMSLNTGDILYVDGCGKDNTGTCPDGAMMDCQYVGCAFGAVLLYPLAQ